MDLSTLQKALETAPIRIKKLVTEIEARQQEARKIEFFQEAVRLLRVSWKDADPGKYTAHWHCFKDNRKVWPRELIDTMGTTKKPPAASLCGFAELDRQPCPQCKEEGLDVGCYEQTEDGPDGDTWTRTRYVLCVECVAVYPGFKQQSDHRF